MTTEAAWLDAKKHEIVLAHELERHKANLFREVCFAVLLAGVLIMGIWAMVVLLLDNKLPLGEVKPILAGLFVVAVGLLGMAFAR